MYQRETKRFAPGLLDAYGSSVGSEWGVEETHLRQSYEQLLVLFRLMQEVVWVVEAALEAWDEPLVIAPVHQRQQIGSCHALRALQEQAAGSSDRLDTTMRSLHDFNRSASIHPD